MVNAYSNRIKLANSAAFLENANMGTFNLPVDVHISFSEPFSGPPRSLYINHPDYMKPDVNTVNGIDLVHNYRVSSIREGAMVKIPIKPVISSVDYKLVQPSDFHILEKRTKLFEVSNPNHVIVVHITKAPCTIYTSPTHKLTDGILMIEKGLEVRNLSEDITDTIVEISKQLLDEFRLDTAAVAFETDNRMLRLIDVNPAYIPFKVKKLYELAIPHMIVTKAMMANKHWLPQIKLRNVEEQIWEHRNERFSV